jgi:intraflagellar transport protein 80
MRPHLSKISASSSTLVTENGLFLCGNSEIINKEGVSVFKSEHPNLSTMLIFNESTIVLGTTDGSLLLVNSNTWKLDKSVTACHKGAVTSLAIADGTILSSGVDGNVKQWSQGLLLRSTLVQANSVVRNLAVFYTWVFYTVNHRLYRKSLNGKEPVSVESKNSSVFLDMTVSLTTNSVLAGTEDGILYIYDAESLSLKQTIFVSSDLAVINAISCNSDGRMVAVSLIGSIAVFDTLTGHPLMTPVNMRNTAFSLAWSSDNAGFFAAADECHEISLLDRFQGIPEKFKDERIVDFVTSVDGAVSVILTSGKIIFFTVAGSSVAEEDLKFGGLFLVSSNQMVGVFDKSGTFTVFGYDKRRLGLVKGLKLNLKRKSFDLTDEILGIAEGANLRVFEPLSGRLMGTYKHGLEIKKVGASVRGNDKLVSFLDAKNDLYINRILAIDRQPIKILAVVEDFKWSNQSDTLIVLDDLKITECYSPSVLFLDESLFIKDHFEVPSESISIKQVQGSLITLETSTGKDHCLYTNPHLNTLFLFSEKNQLNECLRLARFVKDKTVWGVLAGISLRAKNLEILEFALTELTDFPKLELVKKINKMKNPVLKNAGFFVLMKKPEEAINYLIANKKVYSAIKLALDLQRFEQALDIALQQKSHVDTVIYKRNLYLKDYRMGSKETSAKFLQLGKEIPIDENAIRVKINQSKIEEAN